VALRFKYAGADPAVMRVIPSRVAALDIALNAVPPGESLYILAGYTPMRELRSIMQRRDQGEVSRLCAELCSRPARAIRVSGAR